MFCLVCKKDFSYGELFSNRRERSFTDTQGFCFSCLTKLSVLPTDSTGFCNQTDIYKMEKCSDEIHFTHVNNVVFEKNVGICAKHVAEGLKWFAEQKTKKEVVKTVPKPKPAFIQPTLF